MLIRVALLASFLLAAGGCTGGSSLRMASVSGEVTYKGKPVANADVTFTPEAKEARPASGRTDERGRFTLGTFTADDGAVVGKHKVSVIAHGPSRPAKPGEGAGMAGETVPGDPLIPTKYFLPDTSGLIEEVKRGRNYVELSLTD